MCEGALEKVKSYFIKFTERYLLFKQATCGEKEALYSSVLKKIQLFSWWREMLLKKNNIARTLRRWRGETREKGWPSTYTASHLSSCIEFETMGVPFRVL